MTTSTKTEKRHFRADRLAASLGYGSRQEVSLEIRRGALSVGGKKITDPSQKIAANECRACSWYGEALDPLPPLTALLHKPSGYVCTHTDEDEPRIPSVFDLLPPRWRFRNPRMAIAGRLDADTTGLVILSDDGDFVHRLTSPKSRDNTGKTYLVTLADPLKGGEKALFESGTLFLNGERTPLLPAEMEVIDEQTIRLTLFEGRYHQVKRMFAATGNRVTALHREKVGPFTLEGMATEGAWRVF